jgi:non-specific serine/threonine protein kinase
MACVLDRDRNRSGRTPDTGHESQTSNTTFSAREAAEAAGVHERTIRRAINRGTLPATKHHGVFAIERSALDAWRARYVDEPSTIRVILPSAISVHPDHSIPRPLTSLIGRDEHLSGLEYYIVERGVRVLTLSGPGGVGKTRLAIELAARLGASFPGGVWFVSLETADNPDQLLSTIAKTLGYVETAAGTPFDFLVDALSRTRTAIVLDSFERIIDAAPEISMLLRACSQLSIVVTSRTLLRLSGEQAYTVPPLSFPKRQECISVESAMSYPAIDLFVERARAVRPAFTLTSANVETVIEICRLLDGHPLAIELAAARMNSLSVLALRERLGRRLDLLTSDLRDVPTRHRTMRNTIAWSYHNLSGRDQLLLRRLAVFSGGFRLDVAEVVSEGLYATNGLIGSANVVDAIGSLADKSLIQLVDRSERYTMLGTIRAFALEQFADADEEADARNRHADWCIRFCESLPGGWNAASESLEWLSDAEDEYDNINAALNWLERRGHGESLLRLAFAIRWVWEVRGFPTEAVDWFERGLKLSEHASRLTTLKAHAILGRTLKRRGCFDVAAPHLEIALNLAIELDEPRLVAQRIYALGGLKANLQQFDEARYYLHDALARFEHLGDQAGVCGARYFLGIVGIGEDDCEFARAQLKAALEARASSPATFNLSVLHNALALVACELGDFSGAHQHLTLSFDAWNEGRGSNPDVLAEWLAICARLASLARDPERAAVLFGASHALCARIGLPLLVPGPTRYNHSVRFVRATLGEALFDHSWRSGLELTPEGAVEVARSMPTADPVRQLHTLTPRETEVLAMLAAGLRDKDIAQVLFISARTVQGHISHILAKLDAPTRSAAIHLALSRGLIEGQNLLDKASVTLPRSDTGSSS